MLENSLIGVFSMHTRGVSHHNRIGLEIECFIQRKNRDTAIPTPPRGESVVANGQDFNAQRSGSLMERVDVLAQISKDNLAHARSD